MAAPKFKRTYTAAQVEIQSEWDLIEAIAEDAAEENLPITGLDSVLAAKSACEAAGKSVTDETVKALCIVAKFDADSTTKQRRVWRRYGWTAIRTVARRGLSQEAAYEMLAGSHKTVREIERAIPPSRVHVYPKPLPERWLAWAAEMNRVMMRGTQLAAETDAAGLDLDGDAAFAAIIYDRITERKIDAELRELLEQSNVD